MYVIFINKKNGNKERLKLSVDSLKSIREAALEIVTTNSDYFIGVMAQSENDLDLISSFFHNIPVPSSPSKRAIWTGDIAIFILLNMPNEMK